MFALLIISRILFVASIVFIIGYIFGGFAKRKSLRIISRVAAITIIFAFISLNILLAGSRRGNFHCPWSHHREYQMHAPYPPERSHGHWEYFSDSAR
jgi:hypothetical protein